MKKIRMIVCFLIIICLVITNKNVHAVTLKEYEDKVAQYTAELKEKEAKKAQMYAFASVNAPRPQSRQCGVQRDAGG